MSVIVFICAGQMNSAITFPAFENGNEVRLVGSVLDNDIITRLKEDDYHITLKRKLHHGIRYYYFDELKEAVSQADMYLLGVSSFGIDWFCESVLPKLSDNVPVLSVTKGMIDNEDGTLISYPEYFKLRSPEGKKFSFNAVGGPCTSYELADHDDSLVCFCGEDVSVLEKFKSALSAGYYHISVSTDVKGVEFSVAIKNIYALAVTLAVGISQKRDGKIHYNSQAALFEQSLKEMTRLLEINGCPKESIFCGAGDLYVTIYGGRTRMIGTLLGEGIPFEEAVRRLEGVTLESIVISTRTARAVKALDKRGVISKDEFPLLIHVDSLINGGASVNIPWKKFT